MTKLLLKLFVKNHKNAEDPAVRAKIGKLSGFAGIRANVILCAGKRSFGILPPMIVICLGSLESMPFKSPPPFTLPLSSKLGTGKRRWVTLSQGWFTTPYPFCFRASLVAQRTAELFMG